MQDTLFDLATPTPERSDATAATPVLKSLAPEYWDLIWQGLKRHEFRRRFLHDQAVTWYVYLTAPVSRLAGIIDLAPAIVDTPDHVAELAEQVRTGNGQSVHAYLADLPVGFAMPILTIREYPGFDLQQLKSRLGQFAPPQGYTLPARRPGLRAICDDLLSSPVQRTMTIEHAMTGSQPQ